MKLPAWLAPNRIAVYVGALITILTGLAALLAAIDTPEAVALGASVLGLVALLNRFLIGAQKWEDAVLAPIARAQAIEPAVVVDPATSGPVQRVSAPHVIPGDEFLAIRDVDDLGGYGLDVLDESAEADAQPHYGDAGMPTSGEREVTP